MSTGVLLIMWVLMPCMSLLARSEFTYVNSCPGSDIELQAVCSGRRCLKEEDTICLIGRPKIGEVFSAIYSHTGD